MRPRSTQRLNCVFKVELSQFSHCIEISLNWLLSVWFNKDQSKRSILLQARSNFFLTDMFLRLTFFFFVNHKCSVIEPGKIVRCWCLFLNQCLNIRWNYFISHNFKISEISTDFASSYFDLFWISTFALSSGIKNF